MKALMGKDSAMREKMAELVAKDMEIQQLQQELEQIQVLHLKVIVCQNLMFTFTDRLKK